MSEIELKIGEDRTATYNIKRAYAFYVSPTGKECSLKECPNLKLRYTRNEEGNNYQYSKKRIVCFTYTVNGDCTIKLVFLNPRLGGSKIAHLFVNISKNSPEIEIKGFEEFGYFRGNGQIDTNRTSPEVMEIIKNNSISYKVLSIPEGFIDKKVQKKGLIIHRR